MTFVCSVLNSPSADVSRRQDILNLVSTHLTEGGIAQRYSAGLWGG
jgi:hypothetical protein